MFKEAQDEKVEELWWKWRAGHYLFTMGGSFAPKGRNPSYFTFLAFISKIVEFVEKELIFRLSGVRTVCHVPSFILNFLLLVGTQVFQVVY